jgi:hypothetical protein
MQIPYTEEQLRQLEKDQVDSFLDFIEQYDYRYQTES